VEYWNHNSAYHPIIVRIAGSLNGDALDVGCGDGLLIERLARVSRQVTGIDRDRASIERAKQRTAALANATVAVANFSEMTIAPESYDLITFVASLHHMSLGFSLQKAAQLLRPSANSSWWACRPTSR
jgi:2-polyprenyl-3-methyl-5-hydroxy-6-metoxy-1,4-benzoquinol methylase